MDDAAAAEFSDFYRQNYSLILLAAIGRVRDRHTAEDIASETFRVAWRHRQRGGTLSLPWLYGVLRNLVGKEYRRLARAQRLTERFTAVATAPAFPPDSDDDAIRLALRKLRPADREILFMAYWEELSGKEIAGILGIAEGTVWVRLSRARARLRQEFETVGPAEVPESTEVNSHG